jgi:hypothetical protein
MGQLIGDQWLSVNGTKDVVISGTNRFRWVLGESHRRPDAPAEPIRAGSFRGCTVWQYSCASQPEEIRAQQDQQNQQLRSILGDAGFAQFTQVQARIPDRLLVDAVNQPGGNLSEGQSQQLLQILTEVRRQIVGQSDITQNLGSMSPGDATAIMQQQQVLLQPTINSRIQNLLTPEQAKVLQDVLMRHSVFSRDAAF